MKGKTARWIAFVVTQFLLLGTACSQVPFYFGNDLSYVNEMEDCGAVYRESDSALDPFFIMASHGTNLCRVRLWHDPYFLERVPKANPDVHTQYSNLEDVTKTIRRAKEAGMEVMLGFHFSDVWADPGRQVIPRAWKEYAADDDTLAQLLYEYVKNVLELLDDQGLMPEIVKLGNESNGGILAQDELLIKATGEVTFDIEATGEWRGSDERQSKLWNAGIRAVREVGEQATIDPKIALHMADPAGLVDFYDWVVRIGVTDFDIAGFSYYYAWHGGSIQETGDHIRALKTKYPQYDPMIVETGYLWDDENIDGLGNIITNPDPGYFPVSPETQYRYMVDLTQEVIDAGGTGVIFWEPLWVSTECSTPWGQGSSHEHVAYFDHRNNYNLHIGGTWMEAEYLGLPDLKPVAVRFDFDEATRELALVFPSDPGSEYTVLRSADLESWKLARSFRSRVGRLESVSIGRLNDATSLFGKATRLSR